MTSDINGTLNGTVVAIQGNAVDASTLGSSQDGYVLTWVDGNNEWEALAPIKSGLISQTFTSNGTWTCPSDVFNILISACGGGGGGGGGCGNTASGMAGSGGGGAFKVNCVVAVVPGTNYSVIIGTGGGGGPGGKPGSAGNAASGTNTTFGSLFAAPGGGKGWCDWTTSAGYTIGGRNIAGPPLVVSNTIPAGTEPYGSPQGPGCGGWGCSVGQIPASGWDQDNYVGGASGTSSGGGAGGGGGAGMNGNGGAGGNGGASPTNGTNAAANSGAGGGGGGGSTSNVNGGNGGDGGSGQLTIAWIG